MTRSRMTYSTILKLNQRFKTYDEFLSVFSIERKKNFDIWTKFDCKKQPDGIYLCQIQLHLTVNQNLISFRPRTKNFLFSQFFLKNIDLKY